MRKNTPRFAKWLLVKLIRNSQHEEFLGDLEEIYHERLGSKNVFYARVAYWLDLAHLLLGFTSIGPFGNGRMIMQRHYFLIARRNLLKGKWFSLINIGSLSVAMAVCLIICQFLFFELSFDSFHKNNENIYRLVFDKTKDGEYVGTSPYNGYKLASTVVEEIPEIQQSVTIYPAEYGAVISNPKKNILINEDPEAMLFVNGNFLKTFQFPLQYGNKDNALSGLFNIVLTENTAKKYFGSEDPTGKTLKITGGSSPGTYTVSGVLEELPVNSHLKFDFLMPLENLWTLGNGGSVNRYDGWAREWFAYYVTMVESADQELIKSKLNKLLLKYKAKWNGPENIIEKTRFQSLADIHFQPLAGASPDYVKNKGSKQNILIFSTIGLLTIIIAYLNYINLATARSIHRAKEVGIRKTVGALRRQLVGQFMVEAVLVNAISVLLAIGIAVLVLPIFNQVIGIELEWSLFQLPYFWTLLTVILLLGSTLAGIRPAYVMSTFKPARALNSVQKVNRNRFSLRQGLITFQFLISLVLISATYLIYQQISFMKNQSLGMEMDKVLILKGPTLIQDAPKVTDGRDRSQIRAYQLYKDKVFASFKKELHRSPRIQAVNGSGGIPGHLSSISTNSFRKSGDPESAGKPGGRLPVGLGYVDTYGLELIAGSKFTENLTTNRFVIINEEAVKTYGLGSPQEALQEKLIWGDEPMSIQGVVKNFHWQSVKEAHIPIVLHYVDGIQRYISLRIKTSHVGESIGHIRSTYKSIYPNNPFEYFFLDDDFNTQYRADIEFRNLFFIFTLLAVCIACIGLLALVSYSALQRMKEIGVRKILGASTPNLMLLLSKEYFKLIGLAMVLAAPIILYFGQSWLNNYATRVALGVQTFVLPVFILMSISILTVLQQTYGAATANPVESLKP